MSRTLKFTLIYETLKESSDLSDINVYNQGEITVKVNGKQGYGAFIVNHFVIRDAAINVDGSYRERGKAYSVVRILPHGLYVTTDTAVKIVFSPANIRGYIPVTEITIDGKNYTKSRSKDDEVEQDWNLSTGGKRKSKRGRKQRKSKSKTRHHNRK